MEILQKIPVWFAPVVVSAILLGVNDLMKKHAVRDNAFAHVLFLATLSGSLFFLTVKALTGDVWAMFLCGWKVFGLVAAKSTLVAASWWCVYRAMRDLPISIAAPIRASSPLWTLMGAMIFMGELPTMLQLGGMVLILAGFFIFSAAGGKEGFSWKSRSMIWLFAGTLFGSCSALYDKFLLNTMELDREVVQLYFSIDLVVLLGCALLVMRLKKTGYSFKWRWSIPATGILLILSDWFYFYTVGLPDIQISVISMVRRCSCVVSFGIGVWLFKDKNIKRKAFALALILTGVIILALAR